MVLSRKTAIMQPYIFPYLGYFQLINAVDTFVFYDDVNFIKRGWINRNNILVNGQSFLFSIPLQKASQNCLINETKLNFSLKWKEDFFKTLEHNYYKAPFYTEVRALVLSVFDNEFDNISDLSCASVIAVSDFLNLNLTFQRSSELYADTKNFNRSDRLIEICKQSDSSCYINPAGGQKLYDKEYFRKRDVELNFMENQLPAYTQFDKGFVNGLSIIDVLMFNDKSSIIKMLNLYNLL